MMAFRAWPPEEVEILGEWYLRANRGVTRRANSVLPAGLPGSLPLDKAISHAVDFYRSRSLPVFFQMTSASLPPDLDVRLQGLGFARELVVNVQTAELAGLASLPQPASVHLQSNPTTAWIKTYAAAEGYDRESVLIRKRTIERIPGRRVLASATLDRRMVGVGLGVVDGNWVGLFAVATLSDYRRRGVARSILSGLAHWALQNDAKNAYLQVESRNQPALTLYGSMGFKTLYVYWYRVLRD